MYSNRIENIVWLEGRREAERKRIKELGLKKVAEKPFSFSMHRTGRLEKLPRFSLSPRENS